MKYPIRFFLKTAPWLLAVACALSACSRTSSPEESVPQGISASAAGIHPLAIIQAGELPLWFELGPDGPERISTPAEASLVPFTPWPLVRHIRGLLIQDRRLIVGVNREGFLIGVPWGNAVDTNSIALYRISDTAYWDDYSLDSLFFIEGQAVALLYRDDFFVEPSEKPPSPRVLTPEVGRSRPIGLEIPAFSGLPPEEGWDVEGLRRGQDGFWYYRGIRRDQAEPELVYLRTADLTLPGEKSSAAALRQAVRAAPLEEAPPALRPVLERGFSLLGRDADRVSKTVAVLSPGSGGPRYFAAGPEAAGEDMREFFAYYADIDANGMDAGGRAGDGMAGAGVDHDGMAAGESGAPYALIITAEGRGVYGKYRDGVPETGEFSLPALPEGFVYTGIGLCASVLLVPWEEREDWNVGASGFLIINAP
jgi:hypothetical protein